MRLPILMALLIATPALAQELPKFPKAGPPSPVPEPECDTTIANNGEWLLGRWVSPQSRWEFTRQPDRAIAWKLERKGSAGDNFGWQDGAVITGLVNKVTGCTVEMSAGENGAFTFEGVTTEGGKLYGAAANAKGDTARFVLRRER